jgi:hypothetical protein
MKLMLKTRKPRNPFATAARSRAAGAHRPSAGALRQKAKSALRTELADPDPSSP